MPVAREQDDPDEKHPHAPAGTSVGGQFTKTDSNSKPASKPAPKPAPKPVTKQSPKPAAKPAAAKPAARAPGPPGSAHLNLRRGGQNDSAEVRNLQALLAGLGAKLGLDGQYGPETEAAVKAAQAKIGMKPTGRASSAFIRKMADAHALSPCAGGKVSASEGEPVAGELVEAKFDPRQLRDEDGEWTSGGGTAGALKDTLKLASRIQLGEGETLAGSDKVGGEYGMVRVAAIDRGGRRSLRLGIGDSVYGGREDEAGPWKAAPDDSAAQNAERAPLRAERDALELLDNATPEQENRFAELEDMDLAEVYASGYTAVLDAQSARQLSAVLRESSVAGAKLQAEQEAGWDEVEQLTEKLSTVWEEEWDATTARIAELKAKLDDRGPAGYDIIAQGVIPGEWADVHYEVYLDDIGVGVETKLTAVPPGFTRDELQRNEAEASLEPAEVKKLVRVLDKMAGPAAVTAAAMQGIELARTGEWKLASGPLNVTKDMLADAARFAARAGSRPAPLKIGHTDKRFTGDGEPALGWLRNLRVAEDGDVLLGDLDGMPDWLATAMPTAWPDRSIEGFADYTHPTDGERYGLVVDALALLGVTPPGMSSIASLRDLPQALGVAASAGTTARRIVASFGDTTSSGPAPVGPSINQGAQVDPVKIREALGLDPGASDDEVSTAFSTALPSQAAPVAAAAGTIVLASSVWEQTQNDIKKLTGQFAELKRNERDDVIGKAVIAGKFTPVQRQHFTAMWDSNPEATRNLIDALTPNTALAVMASGIAGEGVEADPEYAALFGNDAKER